MQCKCCYSKSNIVWVLIVLHKLQIVHNVWLAELYIKNVFELNKQYKYYADVLVKYNVKIRKLLL